MNKQQQKAECEAVLKTVLWSTWQAIGPDVESSMREEGERLTNRVAYEVILDADRAEMYGARTEPEKATLKDFRQLNWDQQVRKARKLLGRLV